MARRPTSRPWTRLLSLAILIIAAFATILGAGYTPKLGLDLAGGTTVTLQPKSLSTGKAPSKAALDEAVNILRLRVNGNGVGGATVQEQYPFIVASVPAGTRKDILAKLSRTAQLYFREVATGCSTGGTSSNCVQTDETLLTPAQKKQEQEALTKAIASQSAAAASASAHPSASTTGTPATPAASVGSAAPAASVGSAAPAASVGSVGPVGTPAATGAPATTPGTSASTTVSPPPPASAASSPTAVPSATNTTHGRPVSAALAAATGTPSAGSTPPGTASAAPSPPVAASAGSASSTAYPGASAAPASAAPAVGAPSAGATAVAATASAATTSAPTPSGSASAAANPLGPLPAGNDPIMWTEAQAKTALDTLQCGSQQQLSRLGDFEAGSWALGCGSAVNGGDDTSKYLLMPAGVKGTSVKTAAADPETNTAGNQQFATGGWEVNISFKDDAFEKLTTTTAGGMLQVAIVLDGVVQSAPVNTSAIPGDAQITGSFNQASATDLANTLKFGSLPLSFKDAPQTETVSASLGRSSLHAGLLAGGIGLAIVIIYCFVYYRALGIVTVLSLGISGSMVYAAVVLLGHAIGFTLSLAGIAGFIVAVGITADSFVVYYERIKDEIREGKAARSAVESGWRAARRTIISADAVSLLAAIVLYVVTIGDVRGFALTLGLSTALDLVTVFFFTKPLVTILIQRPLFSTGKFSGLTADAPQAPIRRRPPGKSGATVGRRPSSTPAPEDAEPATASTTSTEA